MEDVGVLILTPTSITEQEDFFHITFELKIIEVVKQARTDLDSSSSTLNLSPRVKCWIERINPHTTEGVERYLPPVEGVTDWCLGQGVDLLEIENKGNTV